MASYSLQLRTIVEQATQFEKGLSHRERIEKGRKNVFNFPYPIFDEDYRGVFETNFIRNFYMSEIGFEAEELFLFKLETWMQINMPYFNKMFESELIKFDPLLNSKMDTKSSRNKDTDGNIDSTKNGDNSKTNLQKVTGTQKGNSFDRGLESDTPDSRLAITTADGKGVIEYASKITEDTSNSDVTTTNNVDGSTVDKIKTTGKTKTDITETEDYLLTREGKTGSMTYSKMMMEYRNSLVRIEKKMFEEMQQLFMLVY